jgi:Bacterial archaeo-eukaryotic release factor family 3
VLVLCGMRSHVSAFINRTLHAGKIVSVFYGNYSRFTESDFSTMTWSSIKAYVEERTIDELNEYYEKIGEGMTEEGIISVWEAIAAGRGETLLVEINFQEKGFLEDLNSWQLYLHPPRRSYVELQDAVNELMAITLSKDCRLVFVEDGMLKRYQRIALVTKF